MATAREKRIRVLVVQCREIQGEVPSVMMGVQEGKARQERGRSEGKYWTSESVQGTGEGLWGRRRHLEQVASEACIGDERPSTLKVQKRAV